MGQVTVGARLLATRVTGLVAGATADIRLPEGAVIRGTLLGRTGTPLAGSWVRADLRPGQSIDPYLNTLYVGSGAQTDATGAFTIAGLTPGRYRLVHIEDPIEKPNARPLRGGDDVTAGAVGVRVVAGGLAPISGTVVDEDGKPLAGVYVGATPVGGGPGVSAKTDADGAFTIADVSDVVRYGVRAVKQDHVPGETADIAAGASGVVLRIVRGLEASGRALTKDGTPFAKGAVQLLLDGSDYHVSAPTDADGRFAAKALKDGVYRVEEVLTVIRPGDSGKPRVFGSIKAGDKDVELRQTQ
jgi:protocatechuate 3,4-dioxygenase beta subunit